MGDRRPPDCLLNWANGPTSRFRVPAGIALTSVFGIDHRRASANWPTRFPFFRTSPRRKNHESAISRDRTVSATINVGTGAQGIAVTPDGIKAYVTLFDSNAVLPINLATNAPGAAIAVGARPVQLAVSPDGSKVYVSNAVGSSVTPITTTTDTAGTAIPVVGNAGGIAISPDGTKAYVANNGSTTVTPIDTASNTPGSPITVGSQPSGVAFTPDGSKAYVAVRGDDKVSAITTSTDTAATAFTSVGEPYALAIVPEAVPTVALAQPAAGTVGATVNFTATGTDLDGTITSYTFDFGDGTAPVTQAGNTISHSYAYGSTIGYAASVKANDNLGGVSAKAVRNVAITGAPWAQIAYIANYRGGTVTAVNLANNATLATISVGVHPRNLAVSPDGSKVYVPVVGADAVSVISTVSNTVTANIAAGTSPEAVAFTPDGTKAYVAAFPGAGNTDYGRIQQYRCFDSRRRRPRRPLDSPQWGEALRR